jgi:type I restriction enzyme S subunit
VETELGMIPEGWKVNSLTDIADFQNGLAMQKYPPLSDDDSIPVLKIKELGQSYCDSNSDRCTKNLKPEFIVHDGDVVFSWSGTLLVDLWCGGICGLNQHLFKVTSSQYSKWFYLMWTKHHLYLFQTILLLKE